MLNQSINFLGEYFFAVTVPVRCWSFSKYLSFSFTRHWYRS